MSCLDTSACFDTRGNAASRFCWLAPEAIPQRLDLRQRGWKLSDCHRPDKDCIGMLHAGALDGMEWMGMFSSLDYEARRCVLVVGIEPAHRRATLLQLGFGDAVSDVIDLDELAARAGRIAEASQWLPRQREIGPLKLDLLGREAFGFGKPLNLNPREFALLWRLADSAGHPVSKQSLVEDVWRMGFVPETNSIAVHMSRLRRKLSFVGLAGMIATTSPGGYCLRILANPGAGEEPERRRTGPDQPERIVRRPQLSVSNQ